jgi:hypothetical protein
VRADYRPSEPWLTQGPKQRKFPTAVVFTVVGALVVAGGVGVGLYALLSGGDHRADKTDTSGNADAVFVSAPNATTDGGQQMFADVAAVGNTVVAAGSESSSLLSRPRFVVSKDAGHTWSVASITTEPGARPGGAIPFKIVGTEGAWLALGRTSDHFAAWTSTDGKSWRKLKDGPSAFHSTDHLQQIAKGAQGYVAIGYRTANNKPGAPILWVSADGRSWQRNEGGKLNIPAGKGSVTRLNYVTASSTNMVVSGDIQRSGGKKPTIAALWRSTDRGRSWKEITAPQKDGAFGTIHLAATPAGFFAVRKAKAGDARNGQVVFSRDGATWQEAGRFPLGAGESENFQLLTGSDQGLAALVTGPANQILVYRSRDGATWQPPTDLGQVRNRTINGLAVTGGGAAIADGFQLDSDQDFYLNRIDESGRAGNIDLASVRDAVNPDRSVQALVTAGGRTVAVGATNGDAASWTSSDGVTWRRSDTSGLAGAGQQSLTDVAQGQRGWASIGRDGAQAMLATSTDAASWQRAKDTALGSVEGITLSAVTGGPKGYVVVGWQGTVPQETSAVAWQSTDLRTWKKAGGDQMGSARNSWPRMLDAASTSTGYVAVGEVVNPTAPAAENTRPEVWTSPDGLRWKPQRPELPDHMVNGRLTHVAVNGQTIAALGRGWFENAGYRTFAVVSGDAGLTWSAAQLPLQGVVKPADVSVTAITATSGGFAAAGAVDNAGDVDVVVWTSTDGRAWQPSNLRGAALSGAGAQQITGLAVVRNRLLGVGLTADSQAQHVTLWQGPAG